MLIPLAQRTAIAIVVLFLGAPAAGQVSNGGASSDAEQRLRGFSVVLLQGDLRGGEVAESLPAAAAKAIADLKDFLPYRSYRLLDTQWTMGSGQATSRLRGTDGKEYEIALQTLPASGNVNVSRFWLREVGGPETGTASTTPEGASYRMMTAAPLHGPLAVFKRSGTIIDTSFSMDIGETVVVGTSRLQGDKALIVLLTAVPRSSNTQGGRR